MFAAGVTLPVAHNWTVTVLGLVTAALRIIKPFGRDPSEALTATGCPTTAPVTVAVPLVQEPALNREPPMVPVVPVRAAIVIHVGQEILGAVPPVETNGAVAVTDVTVPATVCGLTNCQTSPS